MRVHVPPNHPSEHKYLTHISESFVAPDKVNADLNITVNVVNPNIVPAILLNASLALFYADARAGTPIKFGAVQVT